MPSVTYIPVEEVRSTRQGRPMSEKSRELADFCEAHVAQAIDLGKAMTIELGEDERPSTVQAAFKRAAAAAGAKVKFFNLETRPHFNPRKKENESETSKFQIIVSPLEAGETAEEVEDEEDEEDEDSEESAAS